MTTNNELIKMLQDEDSQPAWVSSYLLMGRVLDSMKKTEAIQFMIDTLQVLEDELNDYENSNAI